MNPMKCYSCREPMEKVGWRYKGTNFVICDPCHNTTKLKENREFVSLEQTRIRHASAFKPKWTAGLWKPK